MTTSARSLLPSYGRLTDISAYYGLSALSPIASGIDAASGELYNCMSTLVGDEPFEPAFGSNLPLRVFAPMTGALEAQMIQDVYMAAREWVAHIYVDLASTFVIISPDQRSSGITITYNFGGANLEQDIVFSR